MKSTIKTVHEEYFDGKSMGVLLNTVINNDNGEKQETFIFLFKNKRYIFFETIINCFDYTLYGEKVNIKRAYMDETDFDTLYDMSNIGKSFNDYLNWQK